MANFTCFGFMLMLSCGVTITRAQDVKEDKLTEDELRSEKYTICHNKTNMSCPRSRHAVKTRTISCNFECPKGKEYKCKEDNVKGIIEFCAKPEICPPGKMNKVYFDDNHNKSVIEKVNCPADSFQPVPENCYTSCTQFRHEDKAIFEPRGIKVLYEGNSTHAGRGYCDVDRGFVSSEKKMYTSLAHREVITCIKLEDFKTICGGDLRLLPDESCGDICGNGYKVDIWNDFKCSKQSSDNRSVIFQPTAQVYTLTPKTAGISSKITSDVTSTTSTTSTTSSPQNSDWTTILLAVLLPVIAILVIILVICGIVMCKRKTSDSRTTIPDTQRNTRTTKNIKCRRNYYNTTNGDIIIQMDGSSHGSTDTGVAEDISEHESNGEVEEKDQVSQESGFIGGQEMDILKSEGLDSNSSDDDMEQTKLMKV